jgi:multisubunit Na+/H+ antiporter MnhB subunit
MKTRKDVSDMSERKRKIVELGVLAFALFTLVSSIFLPHYVISSLSFFSRPFGKPDVEMINGILTSSAILLGLWALQVKKHKRLSRNVIVFLIFLLQIIFLSFVGYSYFLDSVHYGYLSWITVTYATNSLLINIWSWLIILVQKIVWKEEQ